MELISMSRHCRDRDGFPFTPDLGGPTARECRTSPTRPLTSRSHRTSPHHPFADTTIDDKECQFPQRFSLTPRCIVWDLDELEAWLRERRQASAQGLIKSPPQPDVRLRKTRPVKEH